MYHHLEGDLVELSLTRAVVDVGGIGYDVRIPLSTYDELKGKGRARLLTHLHVREEELTLFGFVSRAERELFRLVLAVAGVGPSIALASLSALAPSEAARALAEGDVKTLQRIKGVGRKLAERLVLELRERVGDLLAGFEGGAPAAAGGARSAAPAGSAVPVQPMDPSIEDAVKALAELGFDRSAARERVEAARRRLAGESAAGSESAAPSVEALVRAGLAAG